MESSSWYTEYCLTDTLTGPDAPCGPGKPIIDGLVPLNHWFCGTCEKDDKIYHIVFVHWYKDGNLESQDPYFAQIKDMSLEAFDALMLEPGMQAVLMEADIAGKVHPITKELVEKDRKDGKKGEEIAEERADIIKGKFLGFKLEHLPAWAKQTRLDEDGKEQLKYWRCNLGSTVES